MLDARTAWYLGLFFGFTIGLGLGVWLPDIFAFLGIK